MPETHVPSLTDLSRKCGLNNSALLHGLQQELQRKYKDLEAGGAREKEAKEQEIQTLTNKLDDTTRDREQLEQRAQKIQEEYNAKTESRDGKAKEIQDKIDATVAVWLGLGG